MATLAHELGHAIHSMLAEHHSLFTQHSCLPLAETASTFGEMMLIDRLLEQETDPGVRRDLLFRQVDDCLRHHHAPGFLRPVRAPGARDDPAGRFGGRAVRRPTWRT